MKLVGIDEAGRGCIIGPLVICGAMIEEDQQDSLKKLGVKDSKLLTPKVREKLEQILPQHVQFHIIEVSPQDVDAAVLSETTNLNWLEADKTIEILKVLNPDRAIVDCPSPNLVAYHQYLTSDLPDSIIVQPEHKADLNHPIVAAASILAKVRRDTRIAEIRERVGEDFGSGYISDPKTKGFLQEYWATYPSIFRKSWAPYRKVVELNA